MTRHLFGRGIVPGGRAATCHGLIVVLSLVAAACGTRAERSALSPAGEHTSSQESSSAVPSVPDRADVSSAPASEAAAASIPVVPGSGNATGRPRQTAGSQESPESGRPVNPGAAATGGPAAAAVPSRGPAKESGTQAPGSPGSPGSGGAAVTVPGGPSKGSPVVVGSVGTYSGPGGTVLFPTVQGAQVWIRDINQKGGLNGHQVQMIVYDDGADPARHRAQLQKAVEQDHVIAFLQQSAPLAGQGSEDYITEKRIPIIGTEGGSVWLFSSPMFFPQMSSGEAFYYSWIAGTAQQVLPASKRLGMVYCAEAQGCADGGRVFKEAAPSLGFELVYQAKASLAQPDFTAECLAARNARTEVLFITLDTNSIRRVAAACLRQGFHPRFASGSSVIAESLKDDPALDGLVGSSVVLPWFQSGTPAADEYQRAMRTYGGGSISPGVGTATGWVSGKLLEKAGAHLAEPPTSEGLLKGLWSIKNDDLGGITSPLTFVENQLPQSMACWFDIAIKSRSWVSPSGFTRQCR